jgi:hypothetical protein
MGEKNRVQGDRPETHRAYLGEIKFIPNALGNGTYLGSQFTLSELPPYSHFRKYNQS